MAFADNILNVRLQLKYDSLENWARENPLLKAGEVAIAYLPPKGNGEAPAATTAAAVLMKVGPGAFNSLPFASALAADVYEWAKKPENEFITWVNEQIEHPVLSVVDPDAATKKFITKVEVSDHQVTITRSDVALDDISDKEKIALSADLGAVSGLTTTAKTAVGAINEHDVEIGNLASLNTTNKGNLVSAINEALQAVEVGGTGSVVTVTKQATPTTGSEATYVVNQGGKAVDVKIEIPKYDTSVLGVTNGDDTIVVDNTDAQNPKIKVAANKFDTHGAAGDLKNDLLNGVVIAKSADHAVSADKVDQALTVKVGGADVVFDGSAAKTADVDAAIAAGVAEAKKHADDNDANTEYHVEYDSTNKKIKLVAGADASKMEIDATDFIKDGMIESVELVQEDASGNKGQYLKLTWNDDGKDVTYVPVGELVDVYTGFNGTEVNVAISNTNVVSASLNSKVVTKIANGATAYGWGDHAKAGYAKTADLGDLATKSAVATADIYAKAVTEDKLADAVTTKLNKAWEEVGVAQGLINALDYTATGMDKGKTIATLKETDGKIAATFQDIEIIHSQVSDFETAVQNTNIEGTHEGVTVKDGLNDALDRVGLLESNKVDKTTTVNGKALSSDVRINAEDIYIDSDSGYQRTTVYDRFQALSQTTINGKNISSETGAGADAQAQTIVLYGTDIKMADSDATTLNAAITARQTEAQVNALIAAVLNSITTINCGSSTEVI